jgi:hypothetical protein
VRGHCCPRRLVEQFNKLSEPLTQAPDFLRQLPDGSCCRKSTLAVIRAILLPPAPSSCNLPSLFSPMSGFWPDYPPAGVWTLRVQLGGNGTMGLAGKLGEDRPQRASARSAAAFWFSMLLAVVPLRLTPFAFAACRPWLVIAITDGGRFGSDKRGARPRRRR